MSIYSETFDDSVLLKVLLLIKHLLVKQKVLLSPNLFNLTVHWILKLEQNHKSLVVDALELLGNLLKNYHPIDASVLQIIFDTEFLGNNLQTRSKNKVDAITLATVKLIEAITLDIFQNHPNFIEKMDQVATNCLDILSTVDILDFQQNYYDLATRCLSIIRHVIHFHPEWLEDAPARLPFLIGSFKAYISLNDDTDVIRPQPVQPSQLTLLEPSSQNVMKKNQKVIRNKKKPRVSDKIKRVDECQMPRPMFQHASDSDFSEKENETNPEKYISQQKFRLRLMTTNLVITLAQNVDKKLLFGYFHTFFSEPTSPSLLLAITRESSVRCRTSALQATTMLLFKFRQYLLLAEINDGITTSFTPLVVAIGNTLLSLYEVFSNILARDSNTNILIQTLKAASTLIEVTPIQRCQVKVLSKLVPHVRQLLKLQDPTLKVACLNVMQAVFSSEGMNESLLKTIDLNTLHIQEELEEVEHEEIDEISKLTVENLQLSGMKSENGSNWLITELLQYLGTNSNSLLVQNLPLRIQSLQTLQGIAVFIQLYAVTDLRNIAKALRISLADSSPDMKLHAARTHEAITRNLNKIIVENVNNMYYLDPYYCYWTELQEIVTKEIQNEDKTTVHRSILMDSLVNIECIYDRLSVSFNYRKFF